MSNLALGETALSTLAELVDALNHLSRGTEVDALVTFPLHPDIEQAERVTARIIAGPDGKHYAVFGDPE